jgi:GNAT superfamily N-acetyltransferase
MHFVRRAVRENVLSDPRRVRSEDYREMLTVNGRGWVAEHAGQIVGFGIADHSRRNIWALFVLPAFERRGIGRALLDAMVDWLFAQGPEPLWLSTEPGSRAQHVYRAAGWRECAVTPSGEIRFELSL